MMVKVYEHENQGGSFVLENGLLQVSISALSPNNVTLSVPSWGLQYDVHICPAAAEVSDPAGIHMVQPAIESGPGALIFGGLSALGFDWAVSLTLEPGSLVFKCEARLHNRCALPLWVPCDFGFPSARAWNNPGSRMLLTESDDGALVSNWSSVPSALIRIKDRGAEVDLGPVFLGPYSTAYRRVSLWPAPQVAGDRALSDVMLLALDSHKLKIFSACYSPGRSVYVQLEDRSQLESTLDLDPGSVFEESFGQNVKDIVVRHRGHEEARMTPGVAQISENRTLIAALPSRTSEIWLAALRSNGGSPLCSEDAYISSVLAGTLPHEAPFGTEHALSHLWAIEAFKSGDWDKVQSHLDDALTWNSEDQTTWWFKAVTDRQSGYEADGDNLLNLRFLAPLDPLSRAEAFLCTPVGTAVGPSPLVRPLADSPSLLLDTLCLQIEHGMIQDAARLSLESLHFQDTPLVRYIYAWLLMTTTNLASETAHQVALAGQIGTVGPLPQRRPEIRAIRELSQAFRQDTALQAWVDMIKFKP